MPPPDDEDIDATDAMANTETWRYMIMRDLRRHEGLIKACVTKEMFEAKVGPIQKVLWLIFSVVTTGLVMGVLAALTQSGHFVK